MMASNFMFLCFSICVCRHVCCCVFPFLEIFGLIVSYLFFVYLLSKEKEKGKKHGVGWVRRLGRSQRGFRRGNHDQNISPKHYSQLKKRHMGSGKLA